MNKLRRNQKFNDFSDSEKSDSENSDSDIELIINKKEKKEEKEEKEEKKNINLISLKKLLKPIFHNYNKELNDLIREYNKHNDSDIIEKEYIIIRDDFLCELNNLLIIYDLKETQYDYIDILLNKSYKKINKIFE